MKNFYTGPNKKRNFWASIILLIGLLYGYHYFYGTSKTVSYEYVKATKKDLQKTVEGSGKVVSVSELDIQQLQNGGKVTSVRVHPGDFVTRGQIIATLDSRQAAIQLKQAQASYDKVVNGATSESLDILKQNLKNAQSSYDSTKAGQDLNVTNAKRNLFNANLAVTPLYDSRIQPNSPTVSGSYTCDTEQTYTINVIQSGVAQVTPSTNGNVSISSVPQKIDSCGLYLTFDSTKDYSNGGWTISIPNKLSSSYVTNLNSYNSALVARDTALINAQNSIASAQLSLNQSVAKARPEDLASAQASLDSARLSYENTIIRAPFSGQIGSVSAAVGQQTNSQQGVATIITKDKIAEISLNEIDIVNVKLGQSVELTFDAIPGEKFTGSVSQINTVGDTASNVVSFGVKISIPNADLRIKSGMSVTANIIVDKKAQILTVPSASIKSENDKSYVMEKNTDQTSKTKNTKVYITTGITNDIDTEVLDGLNEGDEVVSKTTTGASTTKTTSAFSLFGGGPRGR